MDTNDSEADSCYEDEEIFFGPWTLREMKKSLQVLPQSLHTAGYVYKDIKTIKIPKIIESSHIPNITESDLERDLSPKRRVYSGSLDPDDPFLILEKIVKDECKSYKHHNTTNKVVIINRSLQPEDIKTIETPKIMESSHIPNITESDLERDLSPKRRVYSGSLDPDDSFLILEKVVKDECESYKHRKTTNKVIINRSLQPEDIKTIETPKIMESSHIPNITESDLERDLSPKRRVYSGSLDPDDSFLILEKIVKDECESYKHRKTTNKVIINRSLQPEDIKTIETPKIMESSHIPNITESDLERDLSPKRRVYSGSLDPDDSFLILEKIVNDECKSYKHHNTTNKVVIINRSLQPEDIKTIETPKIMESSRIPNITESDLERDLSPKRRVYSGSLDPDDSFLILEKIVNDECKSYKHRKTTNKVVITNRSLQPEVVKNAIPTFSISTYIESQVVSSTDGPNRHPNKSPFKLTKMKKWEYAPIPQENTFELFRQLKTKTTIIKTPETPVLQKTSQPSNKYQDVASVVIQTEIPDTKMPKSQRAKLPSLIPRAVAATKMLKIQRAKLPSLIPRAVAVKRFSGGKAQKPPRNSQEGGSSSHMTLRQANLLHRTQKRTITKPKKYR